MGMKVPKYISQLYGSAHAFRATKRRDARQAEAALNRLGLGCACTPAYSEIQQMRELLKEIRRKLSVADWGR